MTEEEYVRSKWDILETTSYWTIMGQAYTGRKTDAEAWSAAAEFTRQREEEIRQVEAQYVLLGADQLDTWSNAMSYDNWDPERSWWFHLWVQRALVMARLEAALAELKRGMK